jgi:hypothetical protein
MRMDFAVDTDVTFTGPLRHVAWGGRRRAGNLELPGQFREFILALDERWLASLDALASLVTGCRLLPRGRARLSVLCGSGARQAATAGAWNEHPVERSRYAQACTGRPCQADLHVPIVGRACRLPCAEIHHVCGSQRR